MVAESLDIYHALGAVAFIMFESQYWEWYQICAWVVGIIAALEILSRVVMIAQPFFSVIPAKGKPLDELATIDLCYIWFNRLCTPVFTFQVIQFCWYSSQVVWALDSLGILNTLGAMVAMFIVYDFFYAIYHRSLHIRGIYKYIHKHHHRQTVPTRGNVDAINVHPVEFVMGEYNHLLVMYLVSRVIEIHVLSGLLLCCIFD